MTTKKKVTKKKPAAKIKAKPRKPTAKEKKFVKEYLVDVNGAAAARRAGFAVGRANRTACEKLKMPTIRAAINLELQKRSEKLDLKAEHVLSELAVLAFGDRRKLFPQIVDGKLVPPDISKLTDTELAMVRSIKIKRGEVTVETVDKIKPLELMGRHLALFTDNLNIRASVVNTAIEDMTEEEINAELRRLQPGTTPAPGKAKT